MGCLILSSSFKRYIIHRPPGRSVHWISCKSSNLNDLRSKVRISRNCTNFQRRKSSKRNYYIISTRVIIKAIIITREFVNGPPRYYLAIKGVRKQFVVLETSE